MSSKLNKKNTKSSTDWGDHCVRICRVLRRRDWGMRNASNVWKLDATRGEADFFHERMLFALRNFICRLLYISYNILEEYKPNERTQPTYKVPYIRII